MNAAQLRRVTVESFAHYREGLIELLRDAVRQGASIGFTADLDVQQANTYFDEIKADLANGNMVLLAVVNTNDEQVVAAVQLSLCQKPDGLNCAEVQKLLVRKDVQRRGMGQQLMNAVEITARQYKRGLLYLDTEAGSPAEDFYRAMGYTRSGQAPDYTSGPDGQYRPTTRYYKTLPGPTA